MANNDSALTTHRVLKLLREGHPPKTIAFRLKISQNEVYRVCRTAGVSPKQFRQAGPAQAINFRVTQETRNKFSFLCTRAGMSMTETLVGLIESEYERVTHQLSKPSRHGDNFATGWPLGACPSLRAPRQNENEE